MNIIASLLMIITMITLYFVKKIKIDLNLLDLYIFLLLFIISSILSQIYNLFTNKYWNLLEKGVEYL